MFRSLLMVAVFVVFGVPAALIGIPYSAMVGSTDLMYGFAVTIIGWGLTLAGVKVRTVGRENIPAGKSCILLCNHVSNLDPPVMFPAVPGRMSFYLKAQLMNIPLLGIAMRQGKFIPVARSHSRVDAQRSTEAAQGALDAGYHVMVFPEGTRSTDGQLLPFKKGAFFLAEATGAPVVPMVVRGTRAMMPKGTNALTPGTATVEFLPAMYAKNFASRDELMGAVRAAMEEALAR